MTAEPTGEHRPPRSNARLIALVIAALTASAAFVALGQWQLERRSWKLGLIARVEQRLRAPPVPAPGPARWPRISADADEYRRVHVIGSYLRERETLVRAATELGSGYWVLTPLRTDGYTVLVNRGFVPAALPSQLRDDSTEPRSEVDVTGLLRLSEPGGAFLQRNDPAAQRWYSRDVQAIARARGLGPVAPYFIDAEAAPTAAGAEAGTPVAGLTVTTFRNAHLAYAITWYALALLAAAAAVQLIRIERHMQRDT